MKHWKLTIALFALLLGAGTDVKVWADAVQGGDIGEGEIRMLNLNANTESAGDFVAGQKILGFKCRASAAGGTCALYDGANAAGAASTLIDEWSEATDEETNLQMWPRPYKLVTDLSVVLSSAEIVIYY